MAIHDAFARLTPYELAFPDLEDARCRFREIDEAVGEGAAAAAGDPGALALTEPAGRALRELRGPDDAPSSVAHHAHLLWHTWRMWSAGETLALVDLHATRYLLDPGSEVEWDGEPPAPAGYLQLPQHLVWLRTDADGPPASLDGFFWSATAEGRLFLLLAAGLRADRPGFSVVALDDLPLADAPGWPSLRLGPDGHDFASTLPGAELEGLAEVGSAGEVVKLAARALGHAARVWPPAAPPHPSTPDAAPPSPGAPPGTGPRPTGLPWRRIGLG